MHDLPRSFPLSGSKQSLYDAVQLVIEDVYVCAAHSTFETLNWSAILETLRRLTGKDCVILDEVLLSNLVICILEDSKLVATTPTLIKPIANLLSCSWPKSNEDGFTHYNRYIGCLTALKVEHQKLHGLPPKRTLRSNHMRLLTGFAYLAFACYLNGLVMVTSEHYFYDLLHQRPLVDVVSTVLPFYEDRSIPDYFVFSTVLMSVVFLSFHPARVVILKRALLIIGTIYLIRSCTLMLTILPDPSFACKSDPLAGSPDEDLFFEGLRSTLQLRKNCGDLVFSGHTSLMIVSALFFTEYINGLLTSRVVRMSIVLLLWMLAFLGALSILACRMHYSIDILFAMLVVTIVFKTYHSLVMSRIIAWYEST